MSGPERCVNPDCTQYGHIQEGACTFPAGTLYNSVSYPAGRHGDRIQMVACNDCGAFVYDMAMHDRFHQSLRGG